MALDDDSDDGSGEDEAGGGGLQADLVASYLAFGMRAIAKRRFVVIAVFLGLAGLTIAAAVLWPRTYKCESRLMAVRNQVLETRGDNWNDALKGADDVILRRENLEAIVKQTDLLRVFRERRPFILRLKDTVLDHLRDPPPEKELLNGMIWTLGNKLVVAMTDQTLTISVEWPEADVSANIVQSAQDNFLESRHIAEISTFTEYISILEGHATSLRAEVDTIAAQIQKLREEKVAAAEKKAGVKAPSTAEPAPVMRRSVAVPPPPTDGDQIAKLKTDLAAKQHTISELDDYRSRRLLEYQGKLAELSAKYTEAHPAIVDAQQNILSLSHESPQVARLRAETRDIEDEIQRRTTAGQAATGGGTGYIALHPAPSTAAAAGLLPAEILGLMQERGDELDPAVGAQLRYAVDKYATLRSQISSARIDLDTAQAAFKHRYKIVMPPEVPLKPTKPKVPVIVAGGLFASILIALMVAIAGELRQGRIVERWQVQQLELPVLAELRFPPRSSD